MSRALTDLVDGYFRTLKQNITMQLEMDGC